MAKIHGLTCEVLLVGVLTACRSEGPITPSVSPSLTPWIITATSAPTATPTRTLTPTPDIRPSTPTPRPTYTPTPAFVPSSNIEMVYGAGVVPSGAVARLGMGNWKSWELSPDGRLLAIGTEVGIYVFDTRTMQQVWAQGTFRAVEEVMWAPEGSRLASRHFEWSEVLIWDGESGELIWILDNHNEVQSMAWSPNGTHMVMGLGSTTITDQTQSVDGVTVWNVIEPEQLWLVQTDVPNSGHVPVSDVDWSPRGDIVAAGLYFEYALFQAYTGVRIGTLPTPSDLPHGRTDKMLFSPDGSLLVTIPGFCCGHSLDYGESAYVFDMETRTMLAELYHDQVVRDARWSPDSRFLVIEAGWRENYRSEHDVHVWDIPSGEQVVVARETQLNLPSLRWSEDGKWAIAADLFTREIWLWDRETWEPRSVGRHFADLALFAPASYVTPHAYGGLLIWDSEDGIPRYDLRRTPAPAEIAWSPDQAQIATLNGRGSFWDMDIPPLTLWDIQSAAPVEIASNAADWFASEDWDLAESNYWCPLLSNEAESRVTYSDMLYATFTWDQDNETHDTRTSAFLTQVAATGEETTLLLEEVVIPSHCSATFSPDGRYLAIGHEPPWPISTSSLDHGFITIYDTATGKRVHDFRGHTGASLDLVWSTDGTMLASASSRDGTAIIWRVGP